ncbi:MAG: single-stranded DNA-binding protein [Deltaproteobacteria bacterium]|nr:MAG: single-stranded DNA-binding protein [Deltaproteobacteria bacterium]
MAMNQAMLEGTVGSIKPNEKGNYVYVSLALDVQYKDGDKKVSETHWFPIVAFNGTAQYLLQNVNVGDRILIVGRLDTTSYEQDGQKVTQLRIVANTVRVTARKKEQ